MFGKLNLRNRIILGYAVPLVFLVIYSTIVYSASSRTKETLKQLVKSHEFVVTTDELILRVSLMARQVRGYLLVGN